MQAIVKYTLFSLFIEPTETDINEISGIKKLIWKLIVSSNSSSVNVKVNSTSISILPLLPSLPPSLNIVILIISTYYN